MAGEQEIWVSAFEVLVEHYNAALIEMRRELGRVAVEHGADSPQVAEVRARIDEATAKRKEAEAEHARVTAEMAAKARLSVQMAAKAMPEQPAQAALPLDEGTPAPSPVPTPPAAQEPAQQPEKPTGKHLAPVRHRNGDFFVADILDAIPKGDLASMEHPLFALKAGDMRVRHYERGGNSVTIKPGPDGCATIHDKDVWIYCVSQLVEAMNRGREDVGRVVRFTAYDFMLSTNRRTDGDSYNRMAEAMARLKGTTIETNIETAGQRERAGFGLVDSWRVIERDGGGRMVAVEVELPRWLWRAVEARHVLTLSRDYFRLRKPLDRRIYELARKHCGAQPKWRVTVKTLHEKSGSTAPLRNFRIAVKALAESNELPDYRVSFDQEGDAVTFYARAEKGAKAQIADIVKGAKRRKRT